MENIIYKNNKTYHCLTINNLKSLKLMFKKIVFFYNDNNTYKIVGIDFEFYKINKNIDENINKNIDNKVASLIQINLENSSNLGLIFIFNPNILTKRKLNIFIRFICSKRIIKIIHGGEALDIPYIFNNVFNKKKKLIKKFLKNTYDTKFICEYLNLDKCNIYDLLHKFNVINDDTLNELNKLNETIGSIYKINLDINSINLDEKYELYVINDVLYLPSLYNKIKIKLKNEINIIQELTNISYYIQRDFDKNFIILYNEINKMNNYFTIDKNKKKTKLIDFFYNYVDLQKNNSLLKYNNITYFNQFINTIIKCLLYENINKKNIIYKSKNMIYKLKNINYKKIILKYPFIINVINKIIF